MLSGIKIGKRKRPPSSSAPRAPQSLQTTQTTSASRKVACDELADGAATAGNCGGNHSAAEALRRSLAGGSDGNRKDDNSECQSKLDSRAYSREHESSAIHNLQSRGRISTTLEAAASEADDNVVIHPASGTSNTGTGLHEKDQQLRFNSRGKLSRHAHDQLRQKTDRNITIQEMAAQERHSAHNMDEDYARNVLRLGKGYGKLDKIMGANSRSGADEEDCTQETSDLAKLYRSNSDNLSPAEVAARSRSRQIAQHDAMSKFTSRSWWWMESPKFDKRYLIALGDKASLVMAPTHRRLEQHAKKGTWTGGQCYIVPLPYSESFVGVDEDIWHEVRRFQSSLREMFRREGRGVIFLETVTRTSRTGGGAALQAKMEVVPVPRAAERDAPLYFKSALAEVAQEWGTHSKMVALDEMKTLRRAVPRGFPYFYCGWEGGGFVQIIENEEDDDDEHGGVGGLRQGGGPRAFRGTSGSTPSGA